MERFEKLLKELCPMGVKEYALEEVGTFYSGLSGKSKKDFESGNAKFISYVNIYNNPSLNINVEDKVQINEGEKQNTIQYGDMLFTGSSETPEECGMCSVLTTKTEENLYLNSFCFGFRFHDLSDKCPSFMKHLFRSRKIRKAICRTANGVTRYNISKKEFAKIRIPIPPLALQEQIAAALDKFECYAAKLQAELQARKEQYEYYRNQLLTRFTPEQQVREYSLGELCDTLSGFPFDSSKFSESGIRLMRGMNIKRGYLDFSEDLNRYWANSDGLEKFLLEEGDIVMSMDGSLVGKSFGLIKEENLPLVLVQRVARIRAQKANNRYIYYCITNFFPDYVDKKKTGGAIPHISMKDICNFKIMLPSEEEQLRIVNILDQFEALVNDLSQGLPAEIAAVQEQYEYYRNKLLTF